VKPHEEERFFATCVGTDGVERTIVITREEHDALLARGARAMGNAAIAAHLAELAKHGLVPK
jgi:hypothetical protein